jgi:hypothetical protein
MQPGQERVSTCLGRWISRLSNSLETKKNGGGPDEPPPFHSFADEPDRYFPILYFAVQGIKPPSGFLSGVSTS